MDVQRRAATSADSEWLFRLTRLALGPTVVEQWGPWDDDLQRGFHEAWFDPDRVVVLVVDGRDVGVLDTEVRDGGVLYLSRIALLPEWQRHGVGAVVVRQLVDEARTAGATAIELDVIEANIDAERFYTQLGFVVTGQEGPKRRLRLPLDA